MASENLASRTLPSEVQEVFARYCAACHGDSEPEADIRLDTLDELAGDARLEVLKKIQQQLHFREMPPRDEPQPDDDERNALNSWLAGQVRAAGGATIEDDVRYPQYGNYVSHELLFSGEIDEPAWTPARRWLVSPQIFHERVMDVFRLTGRDRQNFMTRQFHGVTNPFILPDHSGVRDYDNRTLDGGHLLVMLTNAQWIAGKQIFAARLKVEDSETLMNSLSSADRWYPRQTPEAFRSIILRNDPPSEAQMLAAIQEQFDCVLRRPATDEEVQHYLPLLRASIELGGNTQGLRQILVAVLLESEFLYRLEFGGSEHDEHGRQMLAPREAAYAISYALGDRGPDETLLQAADEGRLQNCGDFEREVLRLLADRVPWRCLSHGRN